jgi:hypothetical protein
LLSGLLALSAVAADLLSGLLPWSAVTAGLLSGLLAWSAVAAGLLPGLRPLSAVLSGFVAPCACLPLVSDCLSLLRASVVRLPPCLAPPRLRPPRLPRRDPVPCALPCCRAAPPAVSAVACCWSCERAVVVCFSPASAVLLLTREVSRRG